MDVNVASDKRAEASRLAKSTCPGIDSPHTAGASSRCPRSTSTNKSPCAAVLSMPGGRVPVVRYVSRTAVRTRVQRASRRLDFGG